MKKCYPILAFLFLFASCTDKYGDFNVAESGLQYRIVESNENAPLPKVGNVLELRYTYEKMDGTILFDSGEAGRKYMKTLEKPAHTGGSIEDGLAMMHEGDSALFKIAAENFLLFSEKYGHLPEGVNALDPIIIKVRLVDIMDEKDMELYMSSRYHTGEDVEMEILDNYLKNANITVEPTASGLYFIERNAGSGDYIKQGDEITVNYTLTLADGSLVETTLGREPMKYVVGREMFIAGWDEAVSMMKKGMTATAIIPSKIGYGAETKGNILPYSTLIFEIEILDVK
jgi:FKBP-type peptidyl-prolyl cis-trans isomerase